MKNNKMENEIPKEQIEIKDQKQKVIINEHPGEDISQEKLADSNNENAESAESPKGEEVIPSNEMLLEIKAQELAELNDKYLRLYAEFDNFKKRKEEEKKQLLRSANEKLLKDLITIIDSFDQALISISEEEKESSNIAKGIGLIYKQLENFIAKHHISTIEALGQKFDPNFHSAIMQQESDEYGSDIVIKEVQKGYLFHGKVLRPTMAIVSK